MRLSYLNHQAGIDLGTTNSEIAIFDDKGNLICIPVDPDGKDIILPSAVFVDKEGKCYTGREALNRMKMDPENGHSEFKRKMGSETKYPLKNLHTNLLPEELSGILLRRLAEVYKNYMGEELRTVVVTVPMRFKENACQSTRIAASGSNEFLLDPNGFVDKKWKTKLNPQVNPKINPEKRSSYYSDQLAVLLLMEPIAAVTAYGMINKSNKNANWLVYDLGGGTFDTAVVNYFEENPEVKCSDGNEQLGGKDMDESLMSHVLDTINNNGYEINETNFYHSNERRKDRIILKYELERIKIELSEKIDASKKELPKDKFNKVKEEISVEIVFPDIMTLKDDNGKAVKLSFPLKALTYNSLIGPQIIETLEIVARMLSKNNLSGRDIDKIILVGGPTKYYYIQELIEQRFGSIVDQEGIDPMTAVAKGAALFAHLRSVQDEDIQAEIKRILLSQDSRCLIEINPPTSTNSLIELVAGKIQKERADSVRSITFKRDDGGWSSGEIEVDNDGSFFADLILKPRCNNGFTIDLHLKVPDIRLIASPLNFSIIHPKIRTPKDIAPYNLNVTLFDGSCYTMVKKNEELEASGSHDFYTIKQILKNGGQENVLEIEITEGQSIYAERNFVVSKLIFTSDMLVTDLPPHEKVPVTITQSGDRSIVASATLNEKYTQGKLSSTKTQYTLEKIQGMVNKLGFEHDLMNHYIQTWGSDKERDEYARLNVDKSLKEIRDLIDKHKESADIKEDEGSSDGAHSDHLAQARNIIADTYEGIERFEFDFIMTRISKRLEFLDSIKKDGGKIQESQPRFKQTYSELKDQYENSVDYETRINAYKEMKTLEDEMKDFDRHFLYTRLVYLLYMFTNTKSHNFTKNFASFLNEIQKASREVNLDIFFKINNVINDWNEDMKDDFHFTLFSGYLSRIRMILPYEVSKSILDWESNDNYAMEDYETVARHFNRLFDEGEFLYDFKYCQVMAKFKAVGMVLKQFVKLAKMLLDNRIDEFLESEADFGRSYFIEQDLAPKGGAGATGGVSLYLKS